MIQRTNSILIDKSLMLIGFTIIEMLTLLVFQLINKLSTVVDEKHFETAKLKENRSKNRYSNILPGEF